VSALQHLGGAGEVFARMAVATLIGCVIGLNRDLRGKPAGVRTHSLVALGSALLTVASLELGWLGGHLDQGAVSRPIQGLITGIGFLGAGVILRDERKHAVHGLTTAASIWLVCCFGIACGLGQWITSLLAVGLALLVLLFGGPLEEAFHRKLKPTAPQPPDGGPGPPE
jgi:putative Mg2+ transporter-C (MgtC) family protein